MKRLLFVILYSLAFIQIGKAQSNEVVLRISHNLTGMEVNTNTIASNNMGHEFYLTRLEYYLSEFIISYDGGQELKVEDVWALVDAFNGDVNINLGELNVNNIEGITFSVGVDPDHNHLDPASWPNGHPLAPHFPSMHWGWAAGYRFIALEGYAGSNLNQRVEIHGLGDSNYGSVTVRKQGVEQDGKIYIDLVADFAKALESISISGGLIVHGETAEAKTCLDNCKVVVFAPNLTTSTHFEEYQSFKVFPNPSAGLFHLDFGNDNVLLPDLILVTDALGREVQRISSIELYQTLNIQTTGNYMINMLKDGQLISSQKIVVK